MSFIAVTFGYNQFNIFNTDTSTATFIDKIKEVAIQSIINSLSKRDSNLTYEINESNTKEENLRKLIKQREQELKTEVDRQAEAKKALEEQLKKEALAAQKQKGKKGKATPPDNKKKKKKNEEEGENKLIVEMREDIDKKNAELQNLLTSKGIFADKKKKLAEILTNYKKMKSTKGSGITIELMDAKGDKVNIYNKIESNANEYLVDKTVYELMMENKNEKGESILEPFRFDGYCMRSIEEDKEYEEMEKTNQKGKKKDAKKK